MAHYFLSTGIPVDASGRCQMNTEPAYMLTSAMFVRNESLVLPSLNLNTSLCTLDTDIHTPRIDSLKRHVYRVYNKASKEQLVQKVSLLFPKQSSDFDDSTEMTNGQFFEDVHGNEQNLYH